MEDNYDPGAMQRTLRVHFDGDRRVVTREKVLEEMDAIIDLQLLEAIYKCGDGPAWYLSFKDPGPVERLGDMGRMDGHDGMRIRVERIDRRSIKFRVHWFPLHMNIGLVKQHMSRMGKNVSVVTEEQTYGSLRLKTGALSGEMTVTDKEYQAIPYKSVIFNRTVLITVLGRTVKCLRCSEFGHHRSTCPQKTHEARRTYADAARTDGRGAEHGTGISNGSPARQAREGTGDSNGLPARQARKGAGDSVEVPVDEGEEKTNDEDDITDKAMEEVEETRMANEKTTKKRQLERDEDIQTKKTRDIQGDEECNEVKPILSMNLAPPGVTTESISIDENVLEI